MSSKILRIAIIVAVVATIGAFAFVALWLALALIPIAIGAGLVALGVLRFKMWRAGMSGSQGIRRF